MRSQDSRRLISIGLTYRPDLFPGSITTTREFLDWMAGEHPLVGDFVKSGEIVDTNVCRNYMYRAKRRYSSQGWLQSSFTLNFPYFEYHREQDIPRSISQMFRHMTALRLRLLRQAGLRSWFDPVQLGGLAQTLLSAVAVGCVGKRSLKNSGLIRWMVAPRPDKRPRGGSVAAAAGHAKPWIRRIAQRLPVSRRLHLP